MADTLKFDLVSPERRLLSVDATMAEIPGAMGDFTALPNHAPFLSTLRPGIVRVHEGGSTREFFVTGGFAEVAGDAASVLAEQAVERSALTRDFLDERLREAEAAVETAGDEAKGAAQQRLNDYRFAIDHLSV